MIEKFLKFKEPTVIEEKDDRKGGIIFRSHVVMTGGQHLMISDAQHGTGYAKIDETLAFPCNEEGEITEWSEVAGGRMMRTEDVIRELNEQ